MKHQAGAEGLGELGKFSKMGRGGPQSGINVL